MIAREAGTEPRRAIALEGELPDIPTPGRRPRPSDPPGLDDPVVRAAYEAGRRAAATQLRAARMMARMGYAPAITIATGTAANADLGSYFTTALTSSSW